MGYERGGGYRRGGFGGPRSFKPKPVEVGKEYDVTITEISRRGDGIAKIEGFIIFVPGAKEGQKERRTKSKNQDHSGWEQIRQRSDSRTRREGRRVVGISSQ
ncbi:MAG: TRAM domain-containing protein [archaeon]|nr:TRAM domain-containing protein [archaeon]